jgi:hypothetical protein
MVVFGVVRQALSSDAFVFPPPDPPLSKVETLSCYSAPYHHI